MRHAIDPALVTRLNSLLSPGIGTYFQEQLQQIMPETLRAPMSEIEFTKFLPVPTSKVLPGAESFVQYMYEPMGFFDWIRDYSKDLPKITVARKKMSSTLECFGGAYDYTDEELLAGQAAAQIQGGGGLQLDVEKAIGAREAAMRFHDTVAWFGGTEVGIHGFFRHPWIPRYILPSNIAAGTAVADILAMLNAAGTAHEERTKGRSIPQELWLPPAQYNYLRTLQMTNLGVNALTWLENNSSTFLKVRKLRKAKDAGENGQDLGVLITPDARVGHVEIPIMFLQKPAQENGFVYTVNCKAKTGGFVTNFPLEITILEFPS